MAAAVAGLVAATFADARVLSVADATDPGDLGVRLAVDAGSMTGQGATLKVTGSLRGSRLTLTFSSPGYRTAGAGKLTEQGGRPTALLRSKDGKDFARITLVTPRGG